MSGQETQINGNRRARQRFPMNLQLEYETPSHSGTGLVRNLSRDGIAFTADGSEEVGTRVRIVVRLPLDRSGPVDLLLRGKVVRAAPGEMAAHITSRVFRRCAAYKTMAASVALV